MTQKLKLFILTFFIGTYSFAQTNILELDHFFSTLYKNDQFNGSVLIAENGKTVFEKSFGFADFANRKFNTKETKFPIASITKTFTATAILQLYEQGELNVNDPVVKYLTDFPYSSITIRHLLSHTSGLQPYDNFFEEIRKQRPDTIFTNKDVIPRYAKLKLPLFYVSGDESNYDNINYIVLAIIVEKVSGITFQGYLKEKIFKPAKMTNTILPKFCFYHYTEKEKKNLANTYWKQHLYSNQYAKADTIPIISTYWHAYNFKGEGEIISTPRDLLKYDQALYNGKLLNEKTLKEAYLPVLLNNGKPNNGFNTGNSFTLGWTIENDSTFGRVVRGSGGMIGLRSTLMRNITKRQTIIIIDNTQNETDDIARDVLKIVNGQMIKPYGRSAAKEFGITIMTKGLITAVKNFELIKVNKNNYSFNENDFNNLGYDFMSNNRKNEALETFKINTQLFPNSWNVYDSYGEALLKYGQKEEAIKMYKKSVELNPDNQNGKKILEELIKK